MSILTQERKEGKLETAKEMIKEGFDIKTICRITKLLKEEIEKLKDK